MSKTLNLFAQLLAAGRVLHEIGRPEEARRRLQSLLALADVPSDIAAEANEIVGRIHFDQENFAHARKHFKLALRLSRDNAELRFLLAEAMAADEKGNWKQARLHYRKAISMKADARYLRGYANLAVQLGNEGLAVRLLRKAVQLAPNDVATLEALTDLLCGLAEFAEAERVLRIARFRDPHNPQIARLWNDVQFDRVRARQASKPASLEVAPTLLPFDESVARQSSFVRRDRASRNTPHLPRLTTFRPDWRQAP